MTKIGMTFMSVVLMGTLSFAQTEDKNLVKNPGFENTQGKLKKNKSIAIAKEWKSPTGLAADLYSTTSKELLSSAPENPYGKEDPLEGNNYAGVNFYSFGDKIPRTYITTQLIGPLKKGMKYCVSFNVSLADNCKYAVNNVGAHLHKKEMAIEERNNLILDGKNDVVIMHSKNQVFSQTFGWETVCGVYEANGGEEWLTIGNFFATRGTKYEKMPKRKGVTAQQQAVAYYFVDDVKVFALDSLEECMCEKVKEEKATVLYSEEFGTNKEFTPESKVEQDRVHFPHLGSKIDPTGVGHLNDLIKVLNDHPEFNIEVIGHMDQAEVDLIEADDRAKDLSQKRVDAVIDFLVKGGIAKERLKGVTMDGKKPATEATDELSQAKNRRVEFKVAN